MCVKIARRQSYLPWRNQHFRPKSWIEKWAYCQGNYAGGTNCLIFRLIGRTYSEQRADRPRLVHCLFLSARWLHGRFPDFQQIEAAMIVFFSSSDASWLCPRLMKAKANLECFEQDGLPGLPLIYSYLSLHGLGSMWWTQICWKVEAGVPFEMPEMVLHISAASGQSAIHTAAHAGWDDVARWLTDHARDSTSCILRRSRQNAQWWFKMESLKLKKPKTPWSKWLSSDSTWIFGPVLRNLFYMKIGACYLSLGIEFGMFTTWSREASPGLINVQAWFRVGSGSMGICYVEWYQADVTPRSWFSVVGRNASPYKKHLIYIYIYTHTYIYIYIYLNTYIYIYQAHKLCNLTRCMRALVNATDTENGSNSDFQGSTATPGHARRVTERFPLEAVMLPPCRAIER